MTTSIVNIGPASWSMSRDQDGHRDYKIAFNITGSIDDGPAQVLATPGLPKPGDIWRFGNDEDVWAFCRQPVTITPRVTEEPNTEWKVEFTFSTKGDSKRCKDQQIEDPLTIPPRVSFNYQKYQEEITEDRFNIAVTNSAWEQFRGPQVEFDKNRPSVKIELNTGSFLLVSLAISMIDHVNQFLLWGFNKRCIKLSTASCNIKYYGQCFKYYELSLDFDIRDDTFDRDLLDEGTKVLHGHWGDDGSWVVDPIGGISTPLKPNLSTSNGSGAITTNTYYVRVTALTQLGETRASPEASIIVNSPGSDGVITISFPPVPGATGGYNCYVSTGPGAETKQNAVSPSIIPVFKLTGVLVGGAAFPVIDTTGSVTADRGNPQHFDQFKDRNGENCKVILDGAGQPSGVQGSDSLIYISLVDHGGQPLTDTSVWAPVVGPVDPVLPWIATTHYVPGNLVQFADPIPNINPNVGKVFICKTNAFGPGQGPPLVGFWQQVGITFNNAQGGYETSLLSVGIFNEKTDYDMGDYVTNPPAAGKIHVEKYEESDFVLLGIPTQF